MSVAFQKILNMQVYYFSTIILYYILTLTTVTTLNCQQTPGKLFLVGGAESVNTNSIYVALKQATNIPSPNRPNITVAISAAPNWTAGLSVYNDYYKPLFNNTGFEPSVLNLAIDNYQNATSNATETGRANIEKIKNADIVFFNGGDQSRHSRAWLNDDGSDSQIMSILRERFNSRSIVVAGTSAGTAVQGEQTFGGGTSYGYYYFNADLKECRIGEELADTRPDDTPFRYNENGAYMKGFGFLTIALTDSHLDARGRFTRLVVAMNQFNKLYGIGVDEDTAVYIHDDVASVYGSSGAWIIDSSEATFPQPDSHFSAQSIRLAYLTEGDSFNFTTKNVTSTKPIISITKGAAYTSKFIFDKDEALRSIKSLVSSVSTQSEGVSRESNPKCRVVFKKQNNRTKGYTSSNSQYTIQDLILNIDTKSYRIKNY